MDMMLVGRYAVMSPPGVSTSGRTGEGWLFEPTVRHAPRGWSAGKTCHLGIAARAEAEQRDFPVGVGVTG